MSQLIKRPGSAIWYLRLHFRGKDIWRSTRKTRKIDAAKEAQRIEAEVRGQVSLSSLFDKVLEQITRIEDHTERDENRRSFARRLLQGTTSKLAVSDAWEAWIVNPRKRDPKANTLAGYAAMWKRFSKWLVRNHKGATYLHEITPTMTEDYASDLWKSNISPATYNAHLKFLQSMCKTLSIKAGLDVNPWDGIPRMESETESKRNFEPEELSAICSTAEGDMRYWFAIGLYTGLRLGDVISLQWNNINFRRNIIEVMPLKTIRKRKTVSFPLHPVLSAMLQELRAKSKSESEFLFPQAVKAYSRDRATITKQVQAHFEACGIQTTEKPTNGHRRRAIVRAGFHSLRHSFVSLCAANQVPEVAIMEMVGHGSPAMTRLYSHAGDEQKARAIAALPVIVFGKRKPDNKTNAKK